MTARRSHRTLPEHREDAALLSFNYVGTLVPRGALAVSLGLLTACAPGGVIYDKPGATYAEWRRDDAACRQAVTVTEGARDTLDRQAYIRCMRERGYRIRAE